MARNPSTRWYAALAVLIVFILLAWLLGAVLTLSEGERVTLRVGLVALGLIGAVALLWYLRPQDEVVDAPVDAKSGDVVAVVASARARLPRGAFDSRAMVLVLGTQGSCKSTLVMKSGTDPELLAGDAVAGDVPGKTALATFWRVKDAILAEAGGPVVTDVVPWRQLVRALRAPRLAAAVGRGDAAPRAAVVCVSCDLFRGTNAQAQVEGLAKLTRERLTEAAREWGIAVPVYVVFTKADKLPHFETWAATLTQDEVRAPVGATLPFDAAAGAIGKERAQAMGTYAERIVPRVEQAFARVVSALAGHRSELLDRESQGERRLTSYELPREVGKLAPDAAKFLVEICRPVHLGVSPQLRGFYLVGARPVVVTDKPAPPAAKSRGQGGGTATSATHVFVPSAATLPEPAAGAAAPSSRRVPQWVFLERLFPEVLLSDAGAASMARGGVRVSTVRRALLGVGIAAALVVSIGVLRSWLGNRDLASRTVAASRDVTALPVITAPQGSIAFPSADALRRLEALRTILDTLNGYATSGAPARLTWGLWNGDALLDRGRRVWLDGYRRQLHTTAYGALVDSLRALPEAPRPTDDYGQDYNMLKAYLIMTGESPRSTSTFLAPVMMTSWMRGQPVDADEMALARKQFEFYAVLLAKENPWPEAEDARIVTHSRGFLNRFTGGEQIYQSMIAKADEATPAAKLADAAPLAPGVLNAPAQVSGAYTAAGYEFMQGAFRNSDRYFEGEQWVVGDATASQTQDRDGILAALRARYTADYVNQWRDFVRNTNVVRPSGARDAGVKDAAKKLGTISGAQSPLLGALAMVASNTGVDSTVAAAFQPVHTVIPPDAKGKNVNEGNQSYVNALVGLQGALEQVSYMPPVVDTASAMAMSQKGQEALGSVTQAKIAARQLAQKFAVDTSAVKIAGTVGALLEAPINGAEAVLKGVAGTRPPATRPAVVAATPIAPPPPPAASGGGGGGDKAAKAAELAAILNERGRAICAAMTPMLQKFPFNPAATAEATIAEVSGLLAPGAGQLPAFRDERLGDLLEKQGDKWVAKAGGPVALSAPFVTFFNKAMQVSAALFDGGSSPRVVFLAKAETSPLIPRVTLTHGSQVAQFTSVTPENRFVWPAPAGREARLLAQFGKNKDREIDKATGEWAIFRLVSHAAKADPMGGGALRAEWNATGKDAKPVAVQFTVESGAPVLQRGWLGAMSCASQVTR